MHSSGKFTCTLLRVLVYRLKISAIYVIFCSVCCGFSAKTKHLFNDYSPQIWAGFNISSFNTAYIFCANCNKFFLLYNNSFMLQGIHLNTQCKIDLLKNISAFIRVDRQFSFSYNLFFHNSPRLDLA